MSDRSYAHLLGFVLEHPWAVTEGMRVEIAGILARRIVGEETDPAQLAALVNRKNLPQPQRGGAVAVIPIYGVIAPRMNLLSEMSGGTTFEALTAQLHDAMANDAVKTIIFDVDSPGGNVAGATEFAAEVLKARAIKPIIAQAQHLMASAAYWPMSCATQIVASPSAQVGSIGVVTMHNDISEALAKTGVKREVIAAGKFKAENFGGGPLSEETREHVKALVDASYTRFVGDIAKGRGVPVSAIRNGFGEGRCVTSEAALALGMIDRIGTLAETIARVQSSTATNKEPIAATVKEPTTDDAAWQNRITSGLLELDM